MTNRDELAKARTQSLIFFMEIFNPVHFISL